MKDAVDDDDDDDDGDARGVIDDDALSFRVVSAAFPGTRMKADADGRMVMAERNAVANTTTRTAADAGRRGVMVTVGAVINREHVTHSIRESVFRTKY
jgi:hypothetical protein